MIKLNQNGCMFISNICIISKFKINITELYQSSSENNLHTFTQFQHKLQREVAFIHRANKNIKGILKSSSYNGFIIFLLIRNTLN